MDVGKGKRLGGAPRQGRWTKQKEDRGQPGRYRGSLIFLVVLGTLVLTGVGTFGWQMDRELRAGILSQRKEALRRPDWIPINRLPKHVPEAFLAVVDTTSFQREPIHGRAEGATLTHDLIRQVHQLGTDLTSEARELALSPILDQRLPRRSVLELYLNRISLGRSDGWPVYGVYHASSEFFGKPPERMTVGEAATLAGILLAPRLRDPEKSPGAVGPRRNEVLRRMRARGAIDEAAYRAAVAEPLGFQPGIEYAPMTRLPDWSRLPEVIRLPAAPPPDLTAKSPPAS